MLWITEDFLSRARRRWIKNSSEEVLHRARRIYLWWNQHLQKFYLLKQLLAVIVWHVQELSTTGFKQKYKAEINTARGGINLRDVQVDELNMCCCFFFCCVTAFVLSGGCDAQTASIWKAEQHCKKVTMFLSQINWFPHYQLIFGFSLAGQHTEKHCGNF